MSDWIAPEDYEQIVLDLHNEFKSNIEAGQYKTIGAIKMDVKSVCQNHWSTTSFKRALQVLLHSDHPKKIDIAGGQHEYGNLADHVIDAAGIALEHDVLVMLENLEELMPKFTCVDCEKTFPHVNSSKRCKECAASFDYGKHWGIWFAGNPDSTDDIDQAGWTTGNAQPQFYMFQSEAQEALDAYWGIGTEQGKYKVALRLPSGDHAFIENKPKPGITLKQLIEEKLGPSAPTQAEKMITEIIAEIDAETSADKLVEDSLGIFD